MKFDPEATMTARAPSRYRVRWTILAYLFGFAFIIYSQRTSFSVAADWISMAGVIVASSCQVEAETSGAAMRRNKVSSC